MDRYIEANRRLWDAWTLLHEQSQEYDLAGFRAGRCALKPIELAELGDVSGRSMLHLQCHFGLDTLSWARRGAQVTGVDLAESAVSLARSLSAELGIPAEFICSNIYDLHEKLERQFDIVFTSYGVLAWLPDIRAWGKTVARFLMPGGTFYIAELHPFTMIFDNTAQVSEFKAVLPYFQRPEPMRFSDLGSYAAPDSAYRSISYEWSHSMADIVNALIDAGLTIEFLHEFPFSIYKGFPFLDQGPDGLWRAPGLEDAMPLLFSIKARKQPV